MTLRPVTRIVAAPIRGGGGAATVRRLLPVVGAESLDPFLLLEELGPTRLERGRAGGELERHWSGFDAVTYVIRGELEHEDAAGERALLRAGDVQWLTTGRGLTCSQLPSRSMREQGGMFHVLQVRLDLPQHLKAVAPRYQTFVQARLPRVAQSGAEITVVAGEALGARGPVETSAPATYQIWSLHPGAALTLTLPSEQRAFVYVMVGTIGVGTPGPPKELAKGELALLGAGDGVRIHGYISPEETSLVLLVGAVPNGAGG